MPSTLRSSSCLAFPIHRPVSRPGEGPPGRIRAAGRISGDNSSRNQARLAVAGGPFTRADRAPDAAKEMLTLPSLPELGRGGEGALPGSAAAVDLGGQRIPDIATALTIGNSPFSPVRPTIARAIGRFI